MRNYLTLFLLMFSSILFAHDVIVKKDGSTILSKVYEIGKKEIKYKKFSNLNGPLYNISIKEVFSVNYENGEKDLFDKIEEIEESRYETVETNGFYKKETNMYSNFSVGFAGFGVKTTGDDRYDLNYDSYGFSLEYLYGIKPINKINLYLELGLKSLMTFAKDIWIVYIENDYMIGGDFKYLSLSVPLNFKYKFNIPNSDWKISPFAGVYLKSNIMAKQEGYGFEHDFIKGRMPDYTEYGVYIESETLKYKKTQFGWQLGLSVEYKDFNLSGYYSRDFQSIVTNKSYFEGVCYPSIYDGYYGFQFGISLGYRLDM